MADIDDIWEGWHAEELLGWGAYGKVYRVSKTDLGHTSYAAAKIIEIPQDVSEVARLANMGMDNLSIRKYFEDTARHIVNEIAVMESLKGAPNVVAIEDSRLIKHESDIGWTICIRMELLQSLADYQEKVGFLTVEEVVRIGIDICNALICCEERSVIHRDVKPENVFRSAFGVYKLGDFGIARQIESSTKSVYSQKGTGPYMAPEVVRGEKYGAGVDVYSLGIMLYRYLNKKRFPFMPPAPLPFTADDEEEALRRRLKGDVMPPPCEASDALADIVLKACEADSGKRYQSARELREDLLAFSEGHYVPGLRVQEIKPEGELVGKGQRQPFEIEARPLVGLGGGPLGITPDDNVTEIESGADQIIVSPPVNEVVPGPPVHTPSERKGSNWPKIAIVVSLVVAVVVATALVLGMVFRSSQHENIISGDESSSSESVSSESSSDPVVAYKETWFGNVKDADGKVTVVSFEGLEGSFVDERGGATEYHGFYTSLRLSNAKVGSDGLSGSCDMQMSWVPHTNESVNGGVAQFRGKMTFKYDSANPDKLICSVQGDSFSGKATITKDRLQWTEGRMNPGYTHDPSETVELTQGLKREG